MLLKSDRPLESLQTGLELLHLLRSSEDLDAVGGADSGQEEGGGGGSSQRFKANAEVEEMLTVYQEATNGAPDGARTHTGEGDETLARSLPSPLVQQRDLGVVAVQQRDCLLGNTFSQVLSIVTLLYLLLYLFSNILAH